MGEESLLLIGEPDDLDRIVEVMRELPDWPADDAKDRELARQLRKKYPELDLIGELRSMIIWMLDHDSRGKEVRIRARVNNWCRNAIEYRQSRADSGPVGGVRTAGRRASTRARTADEFGQTSDSISGW